MIAVSGLSVTLGAFSLADVSFEVASGEYAVLMGKTGSGKTTILESVCGLRSIAAGRIELMGRDVTSLKSAERGVGYVPQDKALFQTMTVRDNIGFSLRVRRWPTREIAKRVDELADLLGVRHLLNRKPPGLSGGEAQRVALGRALAFRPGVLCMDEPLSALDEETREDMYDVLKSVKEVTGVTTLHVTHNLVDASRLGAYILKLHHGRVARIDA